MPGFTEILPCITTSVLLAYATLRLGVIFFKKGKQSVCKYWSRFAFRTTFLLEVLFQLLVSIPSLSDIQVFSYISQSILLFSLAFLVVSIQDFVCYSNRDPTFIKRNWYFLTTPFIIIGIESVYAWDYGIQTVDYGLIRASKIFYEAITPIYIASEIVIPAFYFLWEIKKNDFSGSLRTKIIIATGFFILETILLIVCAVIQIEMINNVIDIGREGFMIFKSMRDPIILMVCFTQDMVDWMLRWLYLDEDAIYNDDDEDERQDPTTIELISPDP